MNNNRNQYKFFTFVVRFMSQALFGLTTGVAIDYGFERLTEVLKKQMEKKKENLTNFTLLGIAFFQLFASCLFIYFIIKILPNTVYQNWQNTISGLAFPALYYGTQTTMYQNIKSIYRKNMLYFTTSNKVNTVPQFL